MFTRKCYRSLIVIVSLFTFCCLACKKDEFKDGGDVFDPNKPSFRKGTKWIYTLRSYDQNGVLTNELESAEEIVRDTMINGTKYFISSQANVFGFKSNGRYEISSYSNEELLKFKYPISENESYSVVQNTQICVPVYGFTASNIDTTYTSTFGKTYNNLVLYVVSSFMTGGCQGRPSISEYLYDPKIGLFVYHKFGDIMLRDYFIIELKSFSY